MEKLTVKNFLNIKDIEFNLSKINIIIGQQASGKSVIAKLVYFFKDFFIKYRSSMQNKQKKAEFDRTIIANFKEIFPYYSWKGQEFELFYELDKYSISIINKKTPNGKPKLSLEYSEYLVKIRWKIIAEYEEKSLEYTKQGKSSQAIFTEYNQEIFPKYILTETQLEIIHSLIFIPAGRSFFGNLQNNVFSLLSENIPIDYFLKKFGSTNEVARYLYGHKERLFYNLHNNSVDQLINQIIVGDFVYEKDQSWIYTSKTRRVNLSNSSSGQQESLPMALILAVLPFLFSEESYFFVEEPEAHLFPTSQKHVISLISQVFNGTEKKHKFIITTHSPYILTAFNNLIQAGNTLKALREKPEQNDLLKDLFKIVPESQILDINDVAAYTIKNGMIESLINEENNLIDTNIIDEVSNEFSQVFEKLIELEFGE